MTTVSELLSPILEQDGEAVASGIAMVVWDGEGQVRCQYTGVVLDVPDIARLLLSGAMELTHKMQGKPKAEEPAEPKLVPKIEVV